MKVKVTYLGVIRYKIGRSDEEYEVREGTSIKDLLFRIADSHSQVKDLISSISDNSVDPTLIIALNGSTVNQANISRTHLKDGDIITLMTVIGGG